MYNTRRSAWVLGLVISACCATCLAELAVIDDAGQTVRLDRPARRIISLAPHITELLFAAGAGDRIVAVTEFSDYPPPARSLPRIGDSARLDRERLVALRPDLVVAWGSGNPAGELAALRRFGIPLFISEPRRLEMIPETLEAFGILAGDPRTAHRAARAFRGRLAALRAEYADRETVQVFFQVADRPLVTVNGAHLISAIIELCGGNNLFGGLSGLAPVISTEAVVALNPEVILFSEYPGHAAAELASQWGAWRTISAVSQGQLYGVPGDAINRAGPRVLDGAAHICTALDAARRHHPVAP